MCLFPQRKISVLMGMYNVSKTLQIAIESIQAQTYSNWELIVCDDGSSDDTYQVASKMAMKDSRIILIRNNQNMGLNVTLNHCLQFATGDYIARMDADDVCVPERFDEQVAFLQSHNNFEIVSSWMTLFDENGDWGVHKTMEYPQAEDVVISSPICHAPVMMKKECMDKVGGYTIDKRILRVEDVNLWIKLYAKGYRCYNIQKPLYKMRNDQNALNRRKYKYRINSTYVRLKGCKELKLGLKYYALSFIPMLIGLVPASLRQKLKRKKSN